MWTRQLFTAIITCLLISCSALQEKEKTNVNNIIKTQEIKKVSATEVTIAGEKLGRSIASKLIGLGRVNCDYSKKMDSIAKMESVSICFGDTITAFNQILSEGLFEAYQYSVDQSLPLEASVQILNSDTILFTYPVVLDSTDQKRCNSTFDFGMYEIKLPKKVIVNSIER